MNIGYLIPENVQPDGFRCFKIFIPDDDYYQYALFGAYEYFGTWTAWERDSLKRGKLAAKAWKEAIEKTREYMNCEPTTQTININCCGSGGTTLVCYGLDGQPIITPQPPNDPFPPPPPVGDSWPVDPGADPAPDGFEDWTVFDVEACAASNAVWQLATYMVVAAESMIDILAVLTSLLVALIGLIPSGILTAIGGASALEIAEAIGKIILSEQASDILNEIADWLTNQKEEIVCTIYEYRYNLPGMRLELVRLLLINVADVVTLDDEEQAAVREFGNAIFPVGLLYQWFYVAGSYIAASDPIDCSLCDPEPPIGHTWEITQNTEPDAAAIISSLPDAIHGYGRPRKNGTTEVAWGVGWLEGFVPSGASALEFYIVQLSSQFGNTFQFYTLDKNLFGFNSTTSVYNESVLVHAPGYLGNTAGYNRVYAKSGSYDLPIWNDNQLSSHLFHIVRADAAQPTPLQTMNITSIRWLDVNGQEITPP